jgi:hypothetical protein
MEAEARRQSRAEVAGDERTRPRKRPRGERRIRRTKALRAGRVRVIDVTRASRSSAEVRSKGRAPRQEASEEKLVVRANGPRSRARGDRAGREEARRESADLIELTMLEVPVQERRRRKACATDAIPLSEVPTRKSGPGIAYEANPKLDAASSNAAHSRAHDRSRAIDARARVCARRRR